MGNENKSMLDVAVAFGGVSIGDTTAKVGFSIDKEAMNIDVAEAVLCGKRLTGRLVALPNGEDPDQQALPGMEETKHELKAAFDVKGYRSTPKKISSGATFVLSSIDVSDLGHFAKRSGRLIVSETAEIPEPEKEESAPSPVPKVGGPWRKTRIEEIGLNPNDATKLKKADILTAGDLQDRMTEDGTWWKRKIKGIGDAAGERIEDVFNRFVTENHVEEPAA